MLIDINRTYSKHIKLLSENEDISCIVQVADVHFETKDMGFIIRIELKNLPVFLRALHQVKNFFEEMGSDKQFVRVSMYNPRAMVDYTSDTVNYICKYVKTYSLETLETNIPVLYKLSGYNPISPWVDAATCDELIDFIETNFEFTLGTKENYKEILSVIKRIKELK